MNARGNRGFLMEIPHNRDEGALERQVWTGTRNEAVEELQVFGGSWNSVQRKSILIKMGFSPGNPTA